MDRDLFDLILDPFINKRMCKVYLRPNLVYLDASSRILVKYRLVLDQAYLLFVPVPGPGVEDLVDDLLCSYIYVSDLLIVPNNVLAVLLHLVL